MTPTNPIAQFRLKRFLAELDGREPQQAHTRAEVAMLQAAHEVNEQEHQRPHREKPKREKRYNANVEEPTMFQPRGRQGELFGGE